jgi:GNAT superfamily N-acetyltransferase
MTTSEDSPLIHAWLRARSIARRLPAPVPEGGGLRLETNSPAETCRYVFATPEPRFFHLAKTITASRVFLKLCTTPETMRALLPHPWEVLELDYLMTPEAEIRIDASQHAGYTLQVDVEERVICARAITNDGALAASGFAAEHEGTFVYDRISVEVAHRRRGLGRRIMAALATARRDPRSQQVLVATEQGCALYESLGWRVRSPFSTAGIPTGTTGQTCP